MIMWEWEVWCFKFFIIFIDLSESYEDLFIDHNFTSEKSQPMIQLFVFLISLVLVNIIYI